MGSIKRYLLAMLQCSDSAFGQDAIEWAITNRVIILTYNEDADKSEIMGRYDELCEKYRAFLEQPKDLCLNL